MMESIIWDFMKEITMPCYTQNEISVPRDACYKAIEPIEKYLKGKKFLAGDNLSYADFMFFEQLFKS